MAILFLRRLRLPRLLGRNLLILHHMRYVRKLDYQGGLRLSPRPHNKTRTRLIIVYFHPFSNIDKYKQNQHVTQGAK